MSPALDTPAWPVTKSDLARYEKDGFFIVRGMFSKDEVDAIRSEFMEMAEGGPVPGLFHPAMCYLKDAEAAQVDPLARYPRVMHPHRWPHLPVGDIALRYTLDSRIGAVLNALLGEEPVAAQSMFYFKPPGARGQALHQDNFYLRVAPGTCMAAWVAIDDADEDNGTLMVVPGSHNLDIACPGKADLSVSFSTEFVQVPEGMREIPVQLKAGDVLFFNGSLIHGSYPNSTEDRFRRAFICHYLPRASAEISAGYKPLFAFDGQEIGSIGDAQGGGPCGTEAPMGDF
ncbi:MAG TPA: phytanoyl-CoA dioxygenase family protein [Capsulimonadaceae bacterium]|nr:phytanoyl-CoA dioxygenase family protein [Capsulimonadaceae bacterium]